MRNHDQLVAELMRRPGVRKEDERLEREAQKQTVGTKPQQDAAKLAALVHARLARGHFVAVDPKDLSRTRCLLHSVRRVGNKSPTLRN